MAERVLVSGEVQRSERGLRLVPLHKNRDTSQSTEQEHISHRGGMEDRVSKYRQIWFPGEPMVGTDPGMGHDPINRSQTEVICFHFQFVQFSEALRDSEAFRSSLMTADRASGLMPCSHSLTHMDRDSMSKPVFSNLEISSSTSIVSRTAFTFAFAALAIVMDEYS